MSSELHPSLRRSRKCATIMPSSPTCDLLIPRLISTPFTLHKTKRSPTTPKASTSTMSRLPSSLLGRKKTSSASSTSSAPTILETCPFNGHHRNLADTPSSRNGLNTRIVQMISMAAPLKAGIARNRLSAAKSTPRSSGQVLLGFFSLVKRTTQ